MIRQFLSDLIAVVCIFVGGYAFLLIGYGLGF